MPEQDYQDFLLILKYREKYGKKPNA